MRAQRWKIAAIVLAMVAGGAACAWGDVAATVNPNYPGLSALITNSGDPTNTDGRCYGWRFFVTKPMVITHIGLFAMHPNAQGQLLDDGLNTTHYVGIWGVGATVDLLRGPVAIGPGGTVEGHYVYVALDEPLTMMPNDPTYNRLLIGVWTGTGNTDLFYHGPATAQTLTAQQAGAIEMQNYTYYYSYNGGNPLENSTVFRSPWGATLDASHYFALNFKYGLLGPAANAGPDVSIYTSEQAVTTLAGVATHTVAGTAMQYRWLEGSTLLQDWTAVGADGAASLSLAEPVARFSIGAHTLTLEVKDTSELTASDDMVLTLADTPPEAQLAPTNQVVEVNVDAIIITAEVADFDGGNLQYQWRKGGEVLDSGTIAVPADGTAVSVDDLLIAAGDPRFPLGTHEVQFEVSDGVNPPVTVAATVEVKDTTGPTLAPTASTTMLWPPNGRLWPVTVWANAEDNGGGLITLGVTVESDEPPCTHCGHRCGGHCGWRDPDWYIDSVDNETGVIQLRLRAERYAWGDGRVYTITITATDESANQSTATVAVRVPHDRRRR